MSFCPTKDIHSIYLDNELPEKFKAEYELHLSSCTECQKEVERIKSLRGMFAADAESITPDSHYIDDSFQRLQIKMAYSKNTARNKKSNTTSIKYIASAAAAAAVVALVIPLRMKTPAAAPVTNYGLSAATGTTNTISVSSGANSVVSMANVNNSPVIANNVSFDSGRSVLVSGNIHETVLSSEAKRREQAYFTKNVKEIEVLRPELKDEAISIRITIPGVGTIPAVAEISMPMGVVKTGRY